MNKANAATAGYNIMNAILYMPQISLSRFGTERYV